MFTAMNRRALIAFSTLLVFAGTRAAWAASTAFKVPLTGAQSVPAVDTSGSGTADITYDPATRVVTWNITYSGLSSPTTMAHFHGPAEAGKNAPVRDLAQHAGQRARKPDNGDRHAHSGAGPAVLGWRMVYQRAHPIPSRRGDPRSGAPSQELTALTGG